jgi:hypothetical protein
VRPPSTAEVFADLRDLGQRVADDFRLYVLWPLVETAKSIGEVIREGVARLREYLAEGPTITPAKARFVEYGVDDAYLGQAFALHDRLTDRFVGPFTEGDLEDVANTLEGHPHAYADEEGLRAGIEAGRTTSTRVVLPEVLL